MSEGVILIGVVVVGGVVIYLMTRGPPAPPVVANPMGYGQCGASYAGVGASVPCELVGKGVKELYEGAKYIVDKSGLGSEAKTAASGIKGWEVVVSPVAINHVLYNEVKRLKFW
jgi:hypothetical protein